MGFFFPGVLTVNSHKGQLQQLDQSNRICNGLQSTSTVNSVISVRNKSRSEKLHPSGKHSPVCVQSCTEVQILPAALLRHLPELLLLM